MAGRRSKGATDETHQSWTRWNVILGVLTSVVVLVIFVTGFNSLPEMLNAVRPTERPGFSAAQLLARFSSYSTSLDFVADGTTVYELSRPLAMGEGDSFIADRVLVDPYYNKEPTDVSTAFVFALQCRSDRRCRSTPLGDTFVIGARSAFENDLLLVVGTSSFELSNPELGTPGTTVVYLMLFDIHERKRMEGGFTLQGCDEDRLLSEGRPSRLRLNADRSFSFDIRTTCARIVSDAHSIELEGSNGARIEYQVTGRFNDHDELEDFRATRTDTPALAPY